MIFVTVGTTYAFDELVREVDEFARRSGEEVIIQLGNTSYQPKNCKYFIFKKDISRYLSAAEIIITHGGAGTLFELLTMGKKIVALENLQVIDKHQSDILGKLESESHIIWCKRPSDIEKCLRLARKKNFRKYSSPECRIPDVIKEFLNNGAQ